jgi:PTH1 family peptidyl-tRNA hydrolase
MKLVVGLGNPGPEYDGTRHNVGFDVLDRLARRHAPTEIARSKFHGALIDCTVANERTLLLKPLTYMNRSGLAVAEATRFYKLEPADDLLVIVDDVALSCGTIRVRGSGGAGGHNGLSDIQQKLGTDAYARLRIGIDAPGSIPQASYVTGQFRPDQRERVEPALEESVEAAVCWIAYGLTETMNQYNRKNTA